MAEAENEKAYLHEDATNANGDNVEMEFKVADYNDTIPPGWRMACICDVEKNMELLKSELCGMTLHIFSLADGTVGGPGYGYKMTNNTDTINDHKLLISDPNSTPSETSSVITMELNHEIVEGGDASDQKISIIEVTESLMNDNQTAVERTIEQVTSITEVTESSTNDNDEAAAKTTINTETLILDSKPTCDSEKDILMESMVNPENGSIAVNIQTSESIQQVCSVQIKNDMQTSTETETSIIYNSNIETERKIRDSDMNIVGQPLTVTLSSTELIDQKINLSSDGDEISTISRESETPQCSEMAENNKTGNDSILNEDNNFQALDETTSEISKDSITIEVDSRKNSSDSSSSSKKKKKPMSEAMQRLTAKKMDSPESRRNDALDAEKRKAKADLERKKKIAEQRNKEDERRARVLERKKKLEDEERVRKEALFKKLTTTDSAKSIDKRSSMKKHSSMSNLSPMKKRQSVDRNVNLNASAIGTEAKDRSRLSTRPKTAMEKRIPSRNVKEKSDVDRSKKSSDPLKRAMTSETRRSLTSSRTPPLKNPARLSSAKPPLPKASPVPPRPATALGIVNTNKRKSTTPKPFKLSSTPAVTDNKLGAKQMPKSKSEIGVSTKAGATKNATSTKKEIGTEKKKIEKKDVKVGATKVTPEKKKEKSKPADSSTPPRNLNEATAKNKLTQKPLPKNGTKKTSAKPKNGKPEKAGQMTEEEAKKALAERRKKAKEEAEAKAKAEQEKDELERIRREEEEKRLAEQLKLEEEKQHALMEQLKAEEEERRQKLMDEKEERERIERERIEDEQRQREEEIEKKTKLEIDRIQKEQERQEMLLENERIERKKRVEKIMARVSSKRSNVEDSESSSPVETTSPEVSNTARLKVDDILRSRGLGKSSEDLTVSSDKPNQNQEDSVFKRSEIDDNSDELKKDIVLKELPMETSSSDIGLTETNGAVELQITGSVDESHTSADDVSTPSETINDAVVAETNASADAESGIEEISISSNQVNVSEILKPAGNDDMHSKDICDELPLENVTELSISAEGNHAEKIKNDNFLNDTNNNKDYFVENKPTTITAWDETAPKGVIIQSEEKQSVESMEKLLNHNNAIALPNAENGVDVNIMESESVGIHSISGVSIQGKYEDLSGDNENGQWGKFEQRMNQIQPGDQVVSSEENKLWKVLEGKVEMSECF